MASKPAVSEVDEPHMQTLKPSTVDKVEWDFDDSTTRSKTMKRKLTKGSNRSLGRSVAFEDEFEARLPLEKHAEQVPLGSELLMNYMLPAFAKVSDLN
jgi:hypothetical protein